MRVISRSDGHSGQSRKEEHKTCGIQALRRPLNLDCNSGQERTGRRALPRFRHPPRPAPPACPPPSLARAARARAAPTGRAAPGAPARSPRCKAARSQPRGGGGGKGWAALPRRRSGKRLMDGAQEIPEFKGTGHRSAGESQPTLGTIVESAFIRFLGRRLHRSGFSEQSPEPGRSGFAPYRLPRSGSSSSGTSQCSDWPT